MKDYSKLLEIADKNCECVDNDEGKRCNACEAAGALNKCAEIIDNALIEIYYRNALVGMQKSY